MIKSSQRRSNLNDYQIIDTNAESIAGCSLCGNKNAGNPGLRRKRNWLKERYAEGLRYKVLRSEEFGEVGMIEYAVGNQAWRPVEAEGYLVIHCLVERIQEAARTLGLEPKVVRLRNANASRKLPTPYGVFSIIYDGKLIAHRPISATRFGSLMRGNVHFISNRAVSNRPHPS